MANGQQKAKQNLHVFHAWAAFQSHENFAAMVYRGQLDRGEIAKQCDFAKSALRQNPAIKKALCQLENKLRESGVLPAKTQQAKVLECQPVAYDQRTSKRIQDKSQQTKLEAENMQLQAENDRLGKENADLRRQLARFGETVEALTEFGMLPE